MINCVLPRALQTNVSSVETIELLFTPITVRTTLMAMAFYTYIGILVVSCWVWYRASSFVPGIQLLRQIGPDQTQVLLKKLDSQCNWMSTDLHLVMGLAYVNRERLQYIE